MHDISDMSQEGLPSTQSLLKATIVAILIGAVILVLAILPAEYGIDPTGLGSKMGLTELSNNTLSNNTPDTSPDNLISLESAVVSPVWKSQAEYRSDSLSITLAPGEGAEIKAKMEQGERFVFTWKSEGGSVSFDMHGEPPDAGDTFSSYWKGVNQNQANGEFIAPFAGTHGWYWLNRGDKDVAVTVSISGYYEKFYKP